MRPLSPKQTSPWRYNATADSRAGCRKLRNGALVAPFRISLARHPLTAEAEYRAWMSYRSPTRLIFSCTSCWRCGAGREHRPSGQALLLGNVQLSVPSLRCSKLKCSSLCDGAAQTRVELGVRLNSPSFLSTRGNDILHPAYPARTKARHRCGGARSKLSGHPSGRTCRHNSRTNHQHRSTRCYC